MMKRFFLGWLFAIVAVSCSSDDGGSFFDSHILVNGSPFTPRQNGDGVNSIRTMSDQSDGYKVRHFVIGTYSGVGDLNPTSLTIDIRYPDTQTSINGTYDFDEAAVLSGRYAGGSYGQYNPHVTFDSGQVTVTSLGGNRYKLEFNNIHGIFPPIPWEVVITGYFDGTFAKTE